MPENKKKEETSLRVVKPKTKKFGLSVPIVRYPHDDFLAKPQAEKADLPAENLDIQNNQNVISKEEVSQVLDIQSKESLISKDLNIGYQRDKTVENLDIGISKNTSVISKEDEIPDIQISKNKNLDIQKSNEPGKWQKYDEKRSNSGVLVRPNPELVRKFKKFCVDNNWTLTYATELAWNKFMETLDIQKNEGLDIGISLDDRRLRTLYKTKPRIIHLYSAYAENPRWSANDDAKASALNEVDIRIIELGILQTLGNRKQKGKINSFGYFLPEIENFLEIEMPEEGIEAMLQINRKSFQRLTGRTVDLSFLNEPAE